MCFMSITCIILSPRIFFCFNFKVSNFKCLQATLLVLSQRSFPKLQKVSKCKTKLSSASKFVQEVPFQIWAISELFKTCLNLKSGFKWTKGLLCKASKSSRGFLVVFLHSHWSEGPQRKFSETQGVFRKTILVFSSWKQLGRIMQAGYEILFL